MARAKIQLVSNCTIARVFSRYLLFSVLLLVFAAKDSGAISVEERYALIIGNSTYLNSPLRNTINDAGAIRDALGRQGFDVKYFTDLSYKSMVSAIQNFGKSLSEGSVGLFYYAGHALQHEGKNYLIPIADVELSEAELEFEAVDLNRILSALKHSKSDTKIVILDSCRNNPFRGFSRSQSSNGLAITTSDAKGMIIAYSTAPGQVALDGVGGTHSPYTNALVKYIGTPNLSIEQVFKKTRSEVVELTKGRQIPWENSSLIGDFHFSTSNQTVKTEPNVEKRESVVKAYSDLSAETLINVHSDELTNGEKGPQLIKIESGEFMMGGNRYNERPEHKVSIEEGLSMSIDEITRSDYNKYLRDVEKPTLNSDYHDTDPMSSVTWKEAVGYCKWLSKSTGANYRLPTEEEWEYVAKTESFNMNNMDNSVWEWTSDCWRETYDAPKKQIDKCSNISIRGGRYKSRKANPTNRRGVSALTVNDDIGFRVIREKDSTPSKIN